MEKLKFQLLNSNHLHDLFFHYKSLSEEDIKLRFFRYLSIDQIKFRLDIIDFINPKIYAIYSDDIIISVCECLIEDDTKSIHIAISCLEKFRNHNHTSKLLKFILQDFSSDYTVIFETLLTNQIANKFASKYFKHQFNNKDFNRYESNLTELNLVL